VVATGRRPQSETRQTRRRFGASFILTDIVNPTHAWITVLIAMAMAVMVLLAASIVERHLHP
jgi:hypothetical protein